MELGLTFKRMFALIDLDARHRAFDSYNRGSIAAMAYHEPPLLKSLLPVVEIDPMTVHPMLRPTRKKRNV